MAKRGDAQKMIGQECEQQCADRRPRALQPDRAQYQECRCGCQKKPEHNERVEHFDPVPAERRDALDQQVIQRIALRLTGADGSAEEFVAVGYQPESTIDLTIVALRQPISSLVDQRDAEIEYRGADENRNAIAARGHLRASALPGAAPADTGRRRGRDR